MKSKLLVTVIVGLGINFASAAENRQLRCGFTEPFYDINLDLDTGKLERVEWDWEDVDPNSDYITTVLDTEARVEVLPVGKALNVKAYSNRKKVLDATLNYKGSDGMSDFNYPFDVVHLDEERGPQYGGCTLGKLTAYDLYQIDEVIHPFVKDASDAIALCYNRAVSSWTEAPSAYDPTKTKFYVLYSQEFVPGEPGGVSDTFASGENELLMNELLKAKTPAEDGASLNYLKAGMWDYCSLYGELLQTRFVQN